MDAKAPIRPIETTAYNARFARMAARCTPSRTAFLGIGGDEIVHAVTDLMYAGAPYTMIQRAKHIHPTVSELIPTMLGDLKPLE